MNAAHIGLPVPEKLKSILEQLHDRDSGRVQMNLHMLYLTNNACYKAGRIITPKGIMVHSTAANNPRLSRYIAPDDGLIGVNANDNHWNTGIP